MPEVRLDEKLYKEAQRRARDAGFDSVDEFVAEQLGSDFSVEQEDFDDRFTPEVIAHLDRISDQMKAGKSVSMEEVDNHLADVREASLKDQVSEEISCPQFRYCTLHGLLAN